MRVYKSVLIESTIKKMVSAVGEYRGCYKYRVWKEIIELFYNSLDEKEKKYVKTILEKEGIDIDKILEGHYG